MRGYGFVYHKGKEEGVKRGNHKGALNQSWRYPVGVILCHCFVLSAEEGSLQKVSRLLVFLATTHCVLTGNLGARRSLPLSSLIYTLSLRHKKGGEQNLNTGLCEPKSCAFLTAIDEESQ